MMWNPPWTLALVMLFGMLNYSPARVLWLLLNLGLILVVAGALWKIYGGAASARWLPIVVTAAFFPAFLTLGMGQIGGVILIGLVAYLYFVQRERWWPAGAALVLVAVKPQLSLSVLGRVAFMDFGG